MEKVMISFLEIEEILSKVLIGSIIKKFNYEKDPKLKAIYALIYVYYSVSSGKYCSIDISKKLFIASLRLIYGYSLKINSVYFDNVVTKEEFQIWLINNMIGKLIRIKRISNGITFIKDLNPYL